MTNQEKKTVTFQCYKGMKELFDEKLKKNKDKKNDILTTIAYQYINGELRVNKNK